MKYKNWLKNKNLSKNTLIAYLSNYERWISYLNGRKPNKAIIVKYLNIHSKTHKPSSTRLMYSAIISSLRFERKWRLVEECRDIKLPSIQFSVRNVISLEEFKYVRSKIIFNDWFEERDWLIFCTLLFTGMRVTELTRFSRRGIYDGNKFLVKGKGNKYRVIYLNCYILELLSKWKWNKICISRENEILTTKQINIIIKRISKKYFNKYITSHGLRRSYATNLLRSDINIEIVRRILGHSNVNTTSKYIQYTDQEVLNTIKNIF